MIGRPPRRSGWSRRRCSPGCRCPMWPGERASLPACCSTGVDECLLEEVMRHFFWKARILEGMGTEGDFNEVDKAWAETGRWAKEVAAFRHAKIQSIRLAGDPNTDRKS